MAGAEAPTLGLSSPKAFQARPRAVRDLGERQRQKWLKAKAHWGRAGAGFLPAPALGGKCEVFQGFRVFAVARQFCTLAK